MSITKWQCHKCGTQTTNFGKIPNPSECPEGSHHVWENSYAEPSLIEKLLQQSFPTYAEIYYSSQIGRAFIKLILGVLILIVAIGAIYLVFNHNSSKQHIEFQNKLAPNQLQLNSSDIQAKEESNSIISDIDDSVQIQNEGSVLVSQSDSSSIIQNINIKIDSTFNDFENKIFIVNANPSNKVYFYNSPNLATKRSAYFNSREEVFLLSIKNGFGYIEFTNSDNQTSIGWIQLSDLIEKP